MISSAVLYLHSRKYYKGRAAQTILVPELEALSTSREELQRRFPKNGLHLRKMIPII
jgi:hypothetical protein